MARLQQRTQAAGTTGSAETSRPSLRDGVTIYTRSSRGPAVLPPSSAMMRQHLRKTWHQHRDARTTRLHRRTGSFVRARHSRCDPTRPPHPAPGVRDDREAPPQRDGMRGGNHNFGKMERQIFLRGGLDRVSRVERVGEISFSTQQVAYRRLQGGTARRPQRKSSFGTVSHPGVHRRPDRRRRSIELRG
jgi:hypothetical protein